MPSTQKPLAHVCACNPQYMCLRDTVIILCVCLSMSIYQPTPYFGLNICTHIYYVATLEHACANTIKYPWLRSLAVQDRSFVLKRGIR